VKPIPFNCPTILPEGYNYLREAVANGHLSGDGPFTKRCHALLEKVLGVPKALLTTSCTDALEMTALLLNISPGDEVIVPSFTFVSTANAYALRGARLVFADVRPDTLNLDETRLARLITSRTKAIVPVHYAGVGCEMDAIRDIASQHAIPLVEDNAHGLMGRYKGRSLGTLSCLATLSFHETKNFSCGEGGALLINDPQFVERGEVLREKGTNRNRFFRGQVDKYTWVDVGSSFLPSDVLAALLYSQLELHETIQARRARIWNSYFHGLADWAADNCVRLPLVPAHCQQAYHMFYLLLPSLSQRQALIAHLKGRGISSVFHYLPLHLSEMGRRFSGRDGDCPVTEAASDRLLRLPFYTDMTEEDQRRVVDGVKSFAVDRSAGRADDLFDIAQRRRAAA
jgi:dTDP-4-amino-4,6-dideoxygalactose transaminase